MFIDHPNGNYRFLRGIAPYSGGVAAHAGFEVVRASFHPLPGLREGFERARAHLAAVGRPLTALCAMELRIPKPLSFEGFVEFNSRYREQLDAWGLLLEDGVNPIARTNVAPRSAGIEEPSVFAFSYTAPSDRGQPTFVAAGSGELPSDELSAEWIVARGDVSDSGMKAKAACVLEIFEQRLAGLGVGWADATAVHVYTVQSLAAIWNAPLLERLGPAALRGVCCFDTRPPIEEIEFEMDARGVRRELIL